MIHGCQMQGGVTVEVLLVDGDTELDEDAGRLVEVVLVPHAVGVVGVEDTAVQGGVTLAVLQVHLG